MRLEVRVFGVPAPQGSKRISRYGGLVEMSKKVKPWRKAVKEAVLEATGGELLFPQYTPVQVRMLFYLPRPAKTKHPVFSVTRPDRSKLERSTEDALTEAGVWYDDGQSVVGWISKIYATETEPPGALITLSSL